MLSLYEQNRAAWDAIAEKGMPEIREIAKRYTKCGDMDRAFGFQNAASHWIAGRNTPGSSSARIARAMLAEEGHAPVAGTEPPAAPMLVVSGPPASLRKLESLAKMLGCEAVEI